MSSSNNSLVMHQPITLRTKKILIIDDDPQFCGDIAFLLGGLYKLSIAHGSQEGMRLITEIEPDLILLDLVMPAHFAADPEREGMEFLKRLKGGDASKIPVIVLTKMDSDDVRKECLTLGAEGFFQKPPFMKELVERIEGIFQL